MHILTIVDIGLCAVGFATAFEPSGYLYDDYYDFPSRIAAAFELLPILIGLSLAGLILARWGIAGL